MRFKSCRSPWVAGALSLSLAVPQGALVGAQAQPAPSTAKPAPQSTAKPAPQPAAQPAPQSTAKPAPQPAAKPAAEAAAVTPPAGTNADTGWPRALALNTGTAVWYQPQIESWVDQKNIVAWSAVSYVPTGAKEPAVGTIKLEGPTSVSVDEKVVRMDLRITEYNFKTLSPDQVKTLVAEVQSRPMNERVIDLARVLAYVDASPLKVREAENIKADPPMVYWAPAPAILVNLDGDPVWGTIEGLDLRYALNTNWDLLEHTPSKMFYLRYNLSWLQASAVTGPWSPVKGKLPESFTKLPANDNWNEVRNSVPGKKLSNKEVPKVFVSTNPAELIVLEGSASYLKVEGAPTLLWVNNTEADLFRMGLNGDYYFLVAGRWFKAATLDGPWTFATPTLPPDFAQIPVEHPRSRVLASVPGTRQAREAVLLASIPRTARVNRKETKAPEVIYQGEPQFKPIEGAKGGVEQAVNTDKDIVKHGDLYYMCFQGVWFMSRAATGPWEVATTIPQEIYSIPASSPAHHVTYVTIEDDDDDEWVNFAYVAAYTGVMIGWGCAVWGSGWYYPPYYGGFYGGYYGYPHTYGMGAWYNPHTGAYGRGYAAYGPYGGVGMGASYNPRTGTYARGASAYGPYGSRSAGQAYNPRTGTYGQTRQGSNVYGNWGDEQRAAWRQLGADRASRELPDRPDHERHSHQRGRGRRDPHGPKWRSDDCRPYRRRRRVCRPRRQRVSPQRRRGVGPEQRLRRLGTLGGHRGAAARSLHVRDDAAGRPARSRQRRAHPGKHADRGPRQLAKQRRFAVRCRELRRRRALAGRRRPAPLGGLPRVGKREALARLEKPYRVQQTVQLDQLGHVSGPAGLMAGPEPGAVVAVEVLVEEHVVAPVRIGLEFLRGAVDGAPSLPVAGEHPDQPVGDLLAHLEQVHFVARPGGAFDFEVVAVEQIEVLQRPQDHDVHRHPDRAPPVGIAAEHAGVRLGREVADPVLLAVNVEPVGVLLVELG